MIESLKFELNQEINQSWYIVTFISEVRFFCHQQKLTYLKAITFNFKHYKQGWPIEIKWFKSLI